MNLILEHKTLTAKTYKQDLFFGLLIGISASLYIFFAHINFFPYLLNSILALITLYTLLIAPKRAILSAGFFIAFFWIYWFGFSFQYYELSYLIPLVSIGLGITMMIFIIPLAFIPNIFIRAVLIFLWSLFTQFDTNWIQPEYMLVYSYFGVEKWQFALILVILVLFRHFQDHKLSWLSFLLLIPAIHLPSTTLADDALAPLKIKLVDTKIMQDYKWDYRNQLSIINDNYQHIDNAVHQGYDVVVLPESAFPLYMNQYPHIIRTLQEKSQNITIITGTLLSEASKHYNVTYIFKNKNVTIAKKTMLVPFGEYVPLPSILKEWVNKTFFNGESDFITADKKTYFDINGTQFLNAICYEALSENMYLEDNGTSPKYMIAISNNGWFLPSTEPSFQKIMIQYFANKYGTTVYHSANRAGSGIITPQ